MRSNGDSHVAGPIPFICSAGPAGLVGSAAASRAPVDRYARWTGPAVGALAARRLTPLDHGDGILYAIPAYPAFGLCTVAGVLVGDALTPPTRGAVRPAGLAPRRARDHLPPRMSPLPAVLAGALVVLLTAAAAVASPDGLGRAGRALTLTCWARPRRPRAALMNMKCDGTAGTVANDVLWPLAVVALVTVPWSLFTACSPGATWRRR
ncbi:hypothetical protein [Streptomyces sp. NPDC054834]